MSPLFAVDFRAYTSARGDCMLEVIVNDSPRYLLGPFANKHQRQVTVDKLRRVATGLINESRERAAEAREERAHAARVREVAERRGSYGQAY